MTSYKKFLTGIVTGDIEPDPPKKRSFWEKLFGSKVESNRQVQSIEDAPVVTKNELTPYEAEFEKIYAEMKLLTKGFCWQDDFKTEFLTDFRKYADKRAEAEISNNSADDENVLGDILSTLDDSQVSIDARKVEVESCKDFIKSFAKTRLRSLDDLSFETLRAIEDGNKYVVTNLAVFDKKADKKKKGAIKSYAYYHSSEEYEWYNEPPYFITLFDMTTFGSATDGITITGNYIAWKSMSQDREVFDILKIKNIKVDTSEKELCIDGNYFEYFHSEITPGLKRMVDCINKYKNQQALKLLTLVD